MTTFACGLRPRYIDSNRLSQSRQQTRGYGGCATGNGHMARLPLASAQAALRREASLSYSCVLRPISFSCRTRRTMTESNDPLQEFAEAAGNLYTLPAVAMEVIRLTNNPRVDVRALKECLENDPALTTKVLRVVNSSLFGLSREVSDLNQALALLGTKPLKLLVLGFSLPERLFADLAGDVLSRYWQSTLTKAVAARQLCRTLHQRDGDEAFIAALLQDLGMLVLIQQLEGPYVDFLDLVFTHRGGLLALERDALGFSHTELTARLLEQWGLPETIVDAIAAGHCQMEVDRLPESSREIARVLHVAELLSDLLTGARDDVLPEVFALGQQYGSLGRQQLDHLVLSLQEKVEQLADVLAVSLPTTDFVELLAAAHCQLSEVASGAVADVVRGDRARVSSGEIEEGLLTQTRSLADAVARFSVPTEALRSESNAPAPINPMASPEQPSSGPSATGLPAVQTTDPALIGRLSVAVAAARQSRSELSLLLVELDHFADIVFTQGRQAAAKMVELLAHACRLIDHPVAQSAAGGEGQCTVVLSDCDRRQAVELAGELLQTMRRLSDQIGTEASRISISIGVASVAVPPKNFPPSDLIEAAGRCLYGAQSSGGDGLKSIGIL